MRGDLPECSIAADHVHEHTAGVIELRQDDVGSLERREWLERRRLGTVAEDVNETIFEFLDRHGCRKFGDVAVAEEEGDWHGETIIAMARGVRCSILNMANPYGAAVRPARRRRS